MDEGIIWNNVYKKYNYTELPWHGVSFPKELIDTLNGLDKHDTCLLTGCGAGDTVKLLSQLGFLNLIGSDVSSVSIDLCRKRFPLHKFFVSKTQDISEYVNKVDFVLDWLVLHHISPNDVNLYINSLSSITKHFAIAFTYTKNVKKMNSKIKDFGKVYSHENESIANCFSEKFSLHFSNFEIETKRMDSLETIHQHCKLLVADGRN